MATRDLHDGHIHPRGHFCGSNCPKHKSEGGSAAPSSRTALTIRSVKHGSSDSGAWMEVRFSDGTEVELRTFPDTIGNVYERVNFKRPGARHSEEVVTCHNDGVHRMVQRGLRTSI